MRLAIVRRANLRRCRRQRYRLDFQIFPPRTPAFGGRTLGSKPMTFESATTARPKRNATSSPQRRLIMTVGDKGGSGKSFFTRALAGLHVAANTADMLLIDGDSTVGTLVKFFGERGGVEPYSLHGKVDERDRLVNELLCRGTRLVIVDMPATSLTKLREISADYDFVAAAQAAGYRLTVVSPVTPYDDSILDLQETIGLFDPERFTTFNDRDPPGADLDAGAATVALPPRVDYVAVVNLGLSEDRTDFALWDEPDAYTRRLFEFVGGVQIELPAMRPRIAALLQKHRLSFADGETSDRLSVTDRGRLQRWNAAAMQSLRGAGGRLGL
jgi:hypothetical protein